MHYDIRCARSSKELENTDDISDKETAKPLPIHCIISGAHGNFSRVSHCKKVIRCAAQRTSSIFHMNLSLFKKRWIYVVWR